MFHKKRVKKPTKYDLGTCIKICKEYKENEHVRIKDICNKYPMAIGTFHNIRNFVENNYENIKLMPVKNKRPENSEQKQKKNKYVGKYEGTSIGPFIRPITETPQYVITSEPERRPSRDPPRGGSRENRQGSKRVPFNPDEFNYKAPKKKII